MTSFGGIAFLELSDGDGYHAWSKTGVMVVKKIPGSDDSVIQKIGMSMPRLSLAALLTAAQLTSMYGVVGNQGTLEFLFESTTCTLESIETPMRVSINADLYETRLNFIRASGAFSSAPSTARITEAGRIRITEAGNIRILE